MAMTNMTDIEIRGNDGRAIAAVEVLNRPDLSAETAADLRRNILAHGIATDAPYFMVVSETTGYLWRGNKESTEVPPTLTFDMQPILARFGPTAKGLRGAHLELLIHQWLQELSAPNGSDGTQAEKALNSSGFVAAIKGASVVAPSL
jgi:hypothetical protein